MTDMSVQLKMIQIENPESLNLILGQSHFIKTVEDIHETVVTGVPGAKFGLAFCESSGLALVRSTGTDDGLQALAERNALANERVWGPTSRWLIRHFLDSCTNSIGSSMVRMCP